jgi:hypothetical protein
MGYIGDFAEDATVRYMWDSNDAAGASITRATDGSIRIYKDNGVAQKTTSNGITDTEDFDGVVGIHALDIDTGNDTGDAGFWVTGSDYMVVLVGATIDGQTVNAVLCHFSIENRFMRGTDSAALASVCTEARLAELAAANMPADLDAVLADTNELQSDDIPGTIAALNDPTAAAIADAVWDEASAGHTDAGKAGEQLWTDVDAILADTNELQSDDIPTLIAALNDLSTAQVNAEMVDVLRTDTVAELSSVPAANATIQQMLQFLYLSLRNKRITTTSTDTIRDDADGANIGQASITDVAETFTKGTYG